MKEEDIRNRDALNRYLELARLDSERILGDKTAFLPVDCPACYGGDYRFQFAKSGFSYVLCSRCSTLFVSPRPKHSDLMLMYTDSPSTRFWVEDFFLPMMEARRAKIFRPRAEFIAAEFPDLSKGRIADVGSGFGLFLEELRRLWPETDMTAIEPSREMARFCRRRALNVIEAVVEDIDSGPDKYDLITSFELLEHLHEPLAFLTKAYDLLNPGGYVFITTLNGLGFDIQILWERSKSVSPPHHLNFFNPKSMALLLEKALFEVVEISTPGELDWDIIEGGYLREGNDPGRFFETVCRYGTEESKRDLQSWIKGHNFSSHMRAIGRKPRDGKE